MFSYSLVLVEEMSKVSQQVEKGKTEMYCSGGRYGHLRKGLPRMTGHRSHYP